MDLKAYLQEKRAVVDEALRGFFPNAEGPGADVVRAMEYSLFAGGKRLRPILCMAGAGAVGGEERHVLQVACALEMIHTYSLIHDDLPVMDDDDLRRGKPTNHKVFGEAMALLAGDGLLTEAFGLMSTTDASGMVPAQAVIKVIGLIADAAGCRGMVGGQAVDVQSEGKEVPPELVHFIHTRKTGALITASVTSGAILGGGNPEQVASITAYGNGIGLAFQISDDILDIEGDRETMGKGVGGDKEKGKVTFPSVHGLGKAKEMEEALVKGAIEALKGFGTEADPLRAIAAYIIERNK